MYRAVDAAFVRQSLAPRARDAHKGSLGTLHILAGSARYRGAAVLCASGALRAGAGLVQLYAVEAVCTAVAAQLPCCMLAPQAAMDATAANGALSGASALLAGPGLGNTRETAALVSALLLAEDVPLVLDADALNTIAGHLATGQEAALRGELLAALAAREAPVTLTPHPGEMARLLGVPTAEVTADPQAAATAFAAQVGCTLVLKGHKTLVATPDGNLYENCAAGNAGLAKGGSGDVLAGIIASLTAQGTAPEIAAACGVWLHARAADVLAEGCGLYALSPADLPEALGRVFYQLGR